MRHLVSFQKVIHYQLFFFSFDFLGPFLCTVFLLGFDLGFGRNWTRQSLLLQILPLLLPFVPLLLLQWEVLPIPLLSLRNFQRRYIDVLEPWFNNQRCRWHTDVLEPWLETLVKISCCDKIKIQMLLHNNAMSYIFKGNSSELWLTK